MGGDHQELAFVLLALALAAIVGLSLGLLGAGGSILAVPILRYAAGLSAKQAVATSLATVGSVALVGAVIAWKEGRLRMTAAVQFALIASLGTMLGVRLATLLSDKAQMALFLLVMVAALVAMTLSRPQLSAETPSPGWVQIITQALVVGIFTGLVGVGGGFLIVPALVAIYRLPMKEATGTSLAVIAINSLFGMAFYSQATTLDWTFTFQFVGSALAGLLLGLATGRKLESRTTERIFFAAVVAVGLYTLVAEFGP